MMTRILALASCLAVCGFAVGCGSSTPPSQAAEESACPAPTDACMNAENYAECLSVEASCEGEVVHLESCPLQFGCSEG